MILDCQTIMRSSALTKVRALLKSVIQISSKACLYPQPGYLKAGFITRYRAKQHEGIEKPCWSAAEARISVGKMSVWAVSPYMRLKAFTLVAWCGTEH